MADTRELKPGDLLVRNEQILEETTVLGLNVILLLRKVGDYKWSFLTQTGETDSYGPLKDDFDYLIECYTHIDDVSDDKELA